MTNASARYQFDANWRVVRAITAFFRALGVPAKAKDWRTWRETAPKTVWNFDHDQLAQAKLNFLTEEQKKKSSF